MHRIVTAFLTLVSLFLSACVEVTPIEENSYYIPDYSIVVVTCDRPNLMLESLELGSAVYGCVDVRIEGWNNVRVEKFINAYGQLCLAQVVEFHNSQPGGYTLILRQGAYTLRCVRNYYNYQYPYRRGW